MNNHIHILCGGELTFIKREGRRHLHKCNKCKAIVNCILCYSYEEMKEMRIIK